jgi:P-type Cu+ transporter
MMERDPVCGMMVSPARAAAQAVYAGKTYFFCCAGCADKFRAEPAKYLNMKAFAATGSDGELVQFSRTGATGAAPALAVSHEDMHASGRPAVKSAVANAYVCPMDPEVREDYPGACPKCGMALEPSLPAAPATRLEYTCPMHPQIVRPGPGACPICGMALEPRTVIADEPENPELVSMTRRFWVCVALTIPVLVLGMSDLIPRQPLQHFFTMRSMGWIELALATPVVLWGGWPFFERGWASVVNRNLNMFTLIALGTGTAFLYSVVAVLFPLLFPATFRSTGGGLPVYFEAATAITTLVLLGQVLELRARSRTSAAIRSLLQLSPKNARLVRADGTELDVPLEHIQV